MKVLVGLLALVDGKKISVLKVDDYIFGEERDGF